MALVCLSVNMYACMCVSVSTCVSIVCICVCAASVCACVCVCVCVCVHARVHMYSGDYNGMTFSDQLGSMSDLFKINSLIK